MGSVSAINSPSQTVWADGNVFLHYNIKKVEIMMIRGRLRIHILYKKCLFCLAMGLGCKGTKIADISWPILVSATREIKSVFKFLKCSCTTQNLVGHLLTVPFDHWERYTKLLTAKEISNKRKIMFNLYSMLCCSVSMLWLLMASAGIEIHVMALIVMRLVLEELR